MPKILIVDDHQMVREGVRALLAAQPGWEICAEAANGRQALAAALQLRPDVIVMDLLIPDLNGLDATRQIRKQLPDTEILALSAYEDFSLVQSAFDAGVRAYLFKSHVRAHLIPAIRALLDRQPYLTPEVSDILLSRIQHAAPGSHSPESVPADPAPLTPREREIVQLLAEGLSNKEIASTLSISIKTVETHRAAIMRKLNIQSLSDLVRYAIRTRIISA